MNPPPLACSIATLTFAATLAGSFGAEISSSGPAGPGLRGPERVATPVPRSASAEPAKTSAKFQLRPGFDVQLWAAEPMLANPVAFSFDGKGRAYVAETYRYRTSTLDIRHYSSMLEDDLDNRTPEDWLAEIKRNFPADWQKLQIETEVVRLLEDRAGTGKADFSSVYAAGMNSLLDGINSGVLAHEDKVWSTNIPNLWLFSGITKEGAAEKRRSLATGFGVRFSYTGHDMHGLILGPDGRLYFSFGDRGAYVKTAEGKTLAFSDEGAVFRCEPDGSHMEAFARGLRNPQELAFDNQGNLFTADNDSDQGDKERWVYVVPQGDSGWRIGWQHNPLGKLRNPWLVEKMYEPRHEGIPFYLVSPVMNIADGPSGVAHNPGTGLPAEYDDHFFVCSFKGSTARSSITMLRVKPSGAGFETVRKAEEFIGAVQATDVEFGPDSQMYFSEWGEGWEGTGRGRIFKLRNAAVLQAQAAQIAEVKKLLGEGFKQRSSSELSGLLSHPDQRIRLNAQWALATKTDAAQTFLAVALKAANPLARLHAIWGTGHIARLAGYQTPAAVPKLLNPLLPLLSDPDKEVRAQTAKVLGEGQVAAASAALTAALKDPSLRVRSFAAHSLAQLGKPESAQPFIAMLRENADKDEFLRHAGVIGLVRCASAETIQTAGGDSSRAVRLAALLAMRRLSDPRIAMFVSDADPALVKEAAHAINDEGITGAYSALAGLIAKPSSDEQLMLRVINANFRLGTTASALALAGFAADPSAAASLRVEALTLLPTWAKPFQRDRVAGLFRPLADRSPAPAADALRSVTAKLLGDKSVEVVVAALQAVAVLQLKDQSTALMGLLTRAGADSKVRIKALETLAALDDPKLKEAIKLAFHDSDPQLRIQASAMLAKIDPAEAARQLIEVFAASDTAGKKLVLTALGTTPGAGADHGIETLLGELRAGKIPGEVQLELLEAAAKRTAKPVKEQLKAYEQGLTKGDPLAAYQVALVGGDKLAGEKLFKEHAVAACMRCHKVEGSGGEAGPDLSKVAATKDRHYLLESLLVPGAKIADGFQSVVLTLQNGDMQAGAIKAETDATMTLQLPGNPPVTVKKADIKTRDNAPSGMPPNMGDLLSKREIRDIIEYIASLK